MQFVLQYYNYYQAFEPAPISATSAMLFAFSIAHKEHFYLTMPDVYPRAVAYFTATPVLQGGELRRNDVPPDKRRSLMGRDNYETRLRTEQGFTRKVGEGRKPSEEAVERAKALGFELAPDETYVQSFTRQTISSIGMAIPSCR